MRGPLRAEIARGNVIAAAAAGAASVAVATAVVAALGDIPWFAVPLAALGAATACALVAWPIARRQAKRASAPIERLAATSATFAAGDHSRRARTDGPREVRLIAESFNTMAGQVDEALEQLKAEEERKSQFVSDVSHELRTPLTAIRGAAETLIDGGMDAEDRERFLATIASESERLGRLASDLLTLQRIEGATGELPLRRVDLREAADRAAAMFEPIMEERGVTLTVKGTAPFVLGDLDRLQQIVANLVDNASRIVGDGGHVYVDLGEDTEGRSVLAVSDDGPGIPDDELAKLFDRFYRADTARTRATGGAGLGLAIVKAIVTSHGGVITAENIKPTGCRFIVRLPALPVDPSE